MAEETHTDEGRAARAVRTGEVVSDKMDKTVVVKVTRKVRHPRYERFIQKSIKLHAHDEENTARIGDVVRVMSTRPLSKSKRWRLVEVVERAK
jgi:small subunit ribosomal protein S17